MLGIFSLNDTIYFRVNTVNKQGSALDATSGPTFSVYSDGSASTSATGSMSKVGSKTGYYEGSFTASSAGFNVGQYDILIEATVDSETPNATIPFQLVSDTQSLEETTAEIQLIGDNVPAIGQGSVSIDHNYGGTDKLRVTSSNNRPLASVVIRAFVKSDYNAGRKSNTYTVGQTSTKTDGRWSSVIRLDPGSYVLEFSKKGSFKTSTTTIKVS